MEIRIKCEREINLDQFVKLETVNLNVQSFALNDDTLNGDVKINGMYQKNNGDNFTHQGFEELIPFTVVFRDRNIKINEILIDEEKINENSTGINCSFILCVNYDVEEVMEVPVETKEEVIPVIAKEPKIIEENVKDNEITEEYTKKLEEKMNNRESIILTNDSNVSFNNLKDNYTCINIYYLNNEKEIERIANEKRISISSILNNNDDFDKTRRIIIDER